MLGVIFGFLIKFVCYSLLLLVGVLLWIRCKYHKQISGASRIYSGSEKPLPLLGHTTLLTLNWQKLSSFILKEVEDTVSLGYRSLCIWAGPWPLICVVNYDDIQKILTSSTTSEKGDEMELLKMAIGNGLITAPKEIWRITRRHFNPMFHQRNMEHFMPTFKRNCEKLVTDLSEHVDGATFDVLEYTLRTGLKNVSNVIYGPNIEIDEKSSEFKLLLKYVMRIPYLGAKRVLLPPLRIPSVCNFFFGKDVKTLFNCADYFTEYARKEMNKNPVLNTKKVEGEEGKRSEDYTGPMNLLDMYAKLQEIHPEFTDEDLKFEIVTLYIAGADTSAGSTATCLLALAQHQHIQDRLYEEICSILCENDDLTMDDLNKMPYLDQVYKETLRWASLIPFIIRKPSEDLVLNDCTIPAGSTIVVGIYGVHMDPKIYPDPRKFDPDRFAQNNKTTRDKGTLIPFSAGPRNCIGRIYNQYFFKVTIVQVLRNFKLSTDQKMENLIFKYGITRLSTEGYKIKLNKRKP